MRRLRTGPDAGYSLTGLYINRPWRVSTHRQGRPYVGPYALSLGGHVRAATARMSSTCTSRLTGLGVFCAPGRLLLRPVASVHCRRLPPRACAGGVLHVRRAGRADPRVLPAPRARSRSPASSLGRRVSLSRMVRSKLRRKAASSARAISDICFGGFLNRWRSAPPHPCPPSPEWATLRCPACSRAARPLRGWPRPAR